MILIYALFDPRSPDAIRYVGKTEKTLEFRLSRHIAEAKLGLKAHRFHWVRSLLSVNVKPGIRLIETVAEKGSWQELEKYWIAKCRSDGHALTNNASGGNGLESKDWSAIWARDGMRERQSEKLKAHMAKPESRKQRSDAGIARYKDPAERKRTSEASLLSAKNPDVVKKRREETSKSWNDPLVREKRSAGIRYAFSAERRAVMSQAALKRWADPVKRAEIVSAMRNQRKQQCTS